VPTATFACAAARTARVCWQRFVSGCLDPVLRATRVVRVRDSLTSLYSSCLPPAAATCRTLALRWFLVLTLFMVHHAVCRWWTSVPVFSCRHYHSASRWLRPTLPTQHYSTLRAIYCIYFNAHMLFLTSTTRYYLLPPRMPSITYCISTVRCSPLVHCRTYCWFCAAGCLAACRQFTSTCLPLLLAGCCAAGGLNVLYWRYCCHGTHLSLVLVLQLPITLPVCGRLKYLPTDICAGIRPFTVS